MLSRGRSIRAAFVFLADNRERKRLYGKTRISRVHPIPQQSEFSARLRAPGLPARLGVMANVDAFDQVQHVFGDIRRVIRNALEIPRHGEQIERLADMLRILFHEADEFVIAGRAQTIDSVV